MAESGFTGVAVDVMPAGFEVSANPSQDNLWALGCDITIEDFDAAVHEIRLEDISLSGNISVGEFSVDITPDKVNVMDLDVNVVIDGLNSSILESQVVPYDKILKITNLSPETSNEKRYAASARSAKIIYDLISSLSLRVNVTEGDIESLINIVGGIGEETSGLKDKLKILDSIKDMFEWADEAHTTIKTKHNLYSEKTLASGGKASSGTGGTGSGSGSGSGSTGGGFVVLEDWLKYDATLPQVLGAVLGVELHNRLNALEEGCSDSPYATISFVEQTINSLIGGAGEAYDTLIEIQRILQDNEGDINTLLTEIAAKASKDELASLDKKYAALVEALIAKNTEQDTTLEDHETRIDTLEDKEAMFRWVYNADGTRRIETDYDLASLGTVASGGKGKQGSTSGAGGGIMAIKVNGQTISDDDDDRIIELPDYPEKVSDLENDEGYAKSSDVAATYVTKSEHTFLEKRVETNEKDIVTLKEKDTTIEEKITKIKEITDHFFIDEHGLGTHKNFRSTGTLSSGGAAQVGEGGGSGGVTGEYKMYVHTQGDPLKEWTITHNLNKVPNVKVIDSTGNQVYGDVKIENMNIVTVSFGGAFSGIAYLD